MKKLNLLVCGVLLIMITSCSIDNANDATISQSFKPKLLKKITNSDGYWHQYFYNDKNQIQLITQTSNQIILDSTYFFYNNFVLTKTLQRMYVPNTGIINTEKIYNQFNSSIASGTYKIFKDDGTVFQDQTFEYTFTNNLIKTIKFFNLDDTKSSEKIYTHDLAGNLTKWTEIWYNPDNTVSNLKEHTFEDWDVSGLKTQSLLYWNYRIDDIPDMFISSSNCLERTENNQKYRYSYEYDTDGNVTKYSSINELKNITLEYYQ
jgi:hypothetical protein